MRFYGLLDRELLRVEELNVSREKVEWTLVEILRDEPQWASRYSVVAVNLGGAEPRVEHVVAAG